MPGVKNLNRRVTSYDVNQIMANQLMTNTFQLYSFQANFTGDISAYNRKVNFTNIVFDSIKDCSLMWDGYQIYGYFGY